MLRIAIALALAMLTLSTLAQPAGAADLTCTVMKVEKFVEIQHGSEAWIPATVDMKLAAGDQVHTGFKSTAVLKFADGSVVTVQPMTMMKIAQSQQSGNVVSTKLQLRVGEVGAKVGDSATLHSEFKVQTASCTASVRGTIIQRIAFSEALGTTVTMGEEGRLVVQTVAGEVALGQDDTSTVQSAGDAPQTPDEVRTADAQAAPATRLTGSESQARRHLGVPRTSPQNEGGADLTRGQLSTLQEMQADARGLNTLNEAASGRDLNGDGVVESVSSGTRVRTPPFVPLPPLPGVQIPDCCPPPIAP